MWKLIEHDGKVAICLPWQTDYNRPVEKIGRASCRERVLS